MELRSSKGFFLETGFRKGWRMLKALRFAGVWAVPLVLASPASAQIDLSTNLTSAPRQPDRLVPNFTFPAGDIRQAGFPRQSGLLAAVPIDRNLQIGIGRFKVAEPARPRTHMEPERAPTDLRRRERGVAAIGMSLRF
jgi:hypothetical protein